ncbi:MAG: hypothetical protein ACTHM6_13245 [Tepidisphaeraceae bacterium]
MERYTIHQFAKKIGKGHNFVRSLIASGEISYLDMRSPTSSLPRYLIEESQIARLFNARRERQVPKVQPRRHPRRAMKVTETII